VYTGEDDERQEGDDFDASATIAETGGRSDAAESGRNDPACPRERYSAPLPSLDPARYSVDDEPLDPGLTVDYRYLYSIVSGGFDRDEDRRRTLDGKYATLLAGVVASIGFSFRTNVTPISGGAALLYLVPLGFIVWGYTTRLSETAPRIESLEASFPTFPVSTLIEAIKAMRIADQQNREIYDRKSNRFDRAVLATLVVTAIVLAAQFLSTLHVIRIP